MRNPWSTGGVVVQKENNYNEAFISAFILVLIVTNSVTIFSISNILPEDILQM
jgi:hypothetical protein